MLRQLARLTRPVPLAGERAVAIAVYGDSTGRALPAAEAGFEGVACVDDAARALVLLCRLWTTRRLPLARSWATGLLDFVLYMQDADGRFVNFVTEHGRRNEAGRTSLAGGGFWQARGLRALATADRVLGDERAREGLARGFAHVRGPDVPADVRAIYALSALEVLRVGHMPELRADLEAWCEEIAACRIGDVLMDNPDQTSPHLWGHTQEAVLADAGAYLGRADLIAVARGSALAYLAPLIEAGFPDATTQPYGVACAIDAMDRLAAVTGQRRFAALATKARLWFDIVYDRRAGRVHDGIDHGHLNRHSGAESNIVAAEALFDHVGRNARAQLRAITACFAPAVRARVAPPPVLVTAIA